MNRTTLVVAYLAAIVAANLSIAHWGPKAAVYNAFLFIGLDLVSRDRLHDLWRGRLIRNMALLIAAGSALSYVLGQWLGTGPFVARIALASAVAFGAAAVVDALAYHYLRKRDWYERVNGSNILGAGVDSLVFVALWPFGFQFTYAFTLWAAKVAGGVTWAMLLKRNEWLERNRRLYTAR
jgi:queuosine precursor transporter